ncbi:MAG: hypothetical protein D6814_09800 [Calditrichaeota bacterium]|nr:MAG: hypothetical protein D6814_09800 [Calditrichota bacterium]
MKYMQNGGFRTHPMMRLTLVFALVFFSGFWVTTAMMYFSKMSLTPASVVHYYRGSQANFTLPKTFGSMLEVTHGHLPVMGLVALLLTHLFIFTGYSKFVKTIFIAGFFVFAFLGELSSWLVRFVHPGFAILKIACFAGLEVSMAFIIWGLFKLLLAGKRRALQQPRKRKMPIQFLEN